MARRLLVLAWCAFAGAALAQEGMPAAASAASAASAGMRHAGHAPAGCSSTALACASAAMPLLDARGRLWLVWVAGGAVSVARSSDGGRSFGPAVELDHAGALLDLGADAKPQIAADGRGHVAVAWGVFKDRNYNAQVRIATSSDDGASFSAPRSLSADAASQRFPALALAADGTLYASWLDKRTVAAARGKGQSAPGAALAWARSDDFGASFGAETVAPDSSCECCRIALAFDAQQHPVVLFRAIFAGSERDHAVMKLGDATSSRHRVADDHWRLEGCPHHGPSLAIAGDGSLHAAWYTLGAARQGLFYARSTDGGRSFSAPLAVGDVARQAGRPSLLARGTTIWLAWKEFDGQRITILLRKSVDSGRHWSADRVLAETAGYADHPQLVADDQAVMLSWLTRDEGYRLLPVDGL